MKGRRSYPDSEGHLKLQPGDHGFKAGMFFIRPPKGDLGWLDGHEITEHEDGTVTVSPSIEGPDWHGYLERGTWREA